MDSIGSDGGGMGGADGDAGRSSGGVGHLGGGASVPLGSQELRVDLLRLSFAPLAWFRDIELDKMLLKSFSCSACKYKLSWIGITSSFVKVAVFSIWHLC